MNINSNDTINLNISTETFTVKSVLNGMVYIDGQNAGSLDDSGVLTLKDYPVTKNMSLYVAYQNGDNVVQSSPVTDLDSAFEEASEGYDSSDVHEQIFEYSGVVEKSGSEYLIQSLGGAKKISDTTTDH